MPLADYRRDPFDDSDQSVLIEAEAHTVPASSPFYVWLDEVPRELDMEEFGGTPMYVREASATADITPDETAGQDSYVYEDVPGTNYGTSIILACGREGGPTYGKYRPLVKFADLSSITAGSVESAKVRLNLEAYGGTYPGEQQIGVHRVTSTWSEGTVTWTTAPTYDLIAADIVGVTAAGYYEWDITAIVNGWLAGTYVNHGLVFVNADESTTDTSRNFTSSDAASNRPMLRVTVPGQEFELVARAATPAADECAVSYPRAALKFNSAAASASILVSYYGTGSPFRVADLA